MSYGLGIDLGTGRTSAATARTRGQGILAQAVPLGRGSDSVPSALRIAADGSIAGPAFDDLEIGGPELRGAERTCRDFVRRVGGAAASPPHRPEELTAHLVRWVIDAVARSEGGRADRVLLTHPARWGARERGLVDAALADLAIDEIGWLPAPEAAAAGCDSTDLGGTVAVYDLGATFSAAVLAGDTDGRRTLRGAPRDLAGVGGGEFDDALFAHVFDRLGDRVGADLDGPDMVAAMALLEADCTVARETLSVHTEAVVPVVLPGVDAWIEVTRAQFEALIRPAVGATVDLLRDAVRAAGLEVSDLDSVLVAGGLGATPLVARTLRDELDARVIVARHPQQVAALGAARSATAAARIRPVTAVPAVQTVVPDLPSRRPVRTRALLVAAGILAATATAVPLSMIDSTREPAPPAVSTVDELAAEEQRPGDAPARGAAPAAPAPGAPAAATTAGDSSARAPRAPMSVRPAAVPANPRLLAPPVGPRTVPGAGVPGVRPGTTTRPSPTSPSPSPRPSEPPATSTPPTSTTPTTSTGPTTSTAPTSTAPTSTSAGPTPSSARPSPPG